jgi:flagellar hook-associated protein 3 FlgL
VINRLPDHVVSDRTLADLSAIKRQMDQTREQLSSGRRILRASDDPAGTAKALTLQAAKDRNERYTSNISSAVDEMNVTDGRLQNASSTLRQVRDLALQAGNGGLSQASLSTLAEQVRNLRQELLSVANATYGGTPVFSGTAAPAEAFVGTPPYVYQGDSGVRERAISEGVFLATNLSGDDVFGSGASSVFAALDTIADDLDAGNVGNVLTTGIAGVDSAAERVLSSLSTLGARTRQAEAARGRLEAAAPDLMRALSDGAPSTTAISRRSPRSKKIH